MINYIANFSRDRNVESVAGKIKDDDVYKKLKAMEECFRQGRKLAVQLLGHAIENENNNSPLSLYVVRRTMVQVKQEHKEMDDLLLAHNNLERKMRRSLLSGIRNSDDIQVVP
uniref:Nup54 domain-containing protein n=1 Tax=Heterorhabditis bacteriophora TaxID=37862 RepID=A0A1I7XHX9_HETBA